jgi:hypothetical protein
MMSPVVILIGWIGQIIVGYYFVRLISYPAIRFVLTIVPCVILTYMVSYDLPALYMPSMLLVTFCWLATIRLYFQFQKNYFYSAIKIYFLNKYEQIVSYLTMIFDISR